MPDRPKSTRTPRRTPESPARTVSFRGGAAPERMPAMFTLPILDDEEGFEAIGDIIDALDQVVDERKGVVVVGDKGNGKTFGVQAAVTQFRTNERREKQGDGRTVTRTVHRIHSPRNTDRLGTIKAIHKAVTASDLVTRERGQSIETEQLFEELVHMLLNGGVSALVFDEAENLSPEAFVLLRDIMSFAEGVSPARVAGKRYTAAGVGILLVGTMELRYSIDESVELGERWVRVHEITPPAPDRLAGLYRLFLPWLAAEAERLSQVSAETTADKSNESRSKARGEQAKDSTSAPGHEPERKPARAITAHKDGAPWIQYVRRTVWQGRDDVTMRTVENHVRSYVRRTVAALADEGVVVHAVDELPFDAELFEWTFAELATKQRAS